MKIKSKIFFFLIFSSFLIIPISFVSAVNYTPTIRADWLYIDTGTFVDSSPNSWETNIKISSGGIDLISFENLGIIAANDNEVLYKARTTYGFEITMHTDVDFRAVYPNINLNKQYSDWFFKIQRLRAFQPGVTSIHSVSWNTIDTGIMRQHNYNGYIPITVGIRDILGNDGTITIGSETFETPGYVADIIRTKVITLRDGIVGGYTDRFTNIADVEKGSVTFQELDDDFSASESNVIAYYQNSNLGWTAGPIQRGQTIQQSMVDGSQSGTEFSSRAIGASSLFNLDAHIQPEVYEFVQYNTIRYASIDYFTYWPIAGNIDSLIGPATKNAPERIIAIHTTNSFMHWDLEVIVEFVATVDSNAALTQAILADPYLRAGDIIWDTSFTGDYKVDVPLQQDKTIFDVINEFFGNLFGVFGGIFNFIIIIIVVGVGLYIFIKIGIPMIKRRAEKSQSKYQKEGLKNG